jgi:GrpB-like predicted nucleotidyltransferase (UPF0157 family)
VRVAFEVGDSRPVVELLARAGAEVVADPVRTPWGSLNARLDGPAGLHLTVFSPEVYVGAPTRVDGRVVLAEPDPDWPRTAAALIEAARSVLGDPAPLLQHAGSTAVPDLPAKPVLDLVLAVDDPADEDAYVPALQQLGYQLHIREPEWHEHRLLKLADPQVNLHVFGLGSTEIDRMLAFRDHLRADPADRERYAAAKRDLADRDWVVVQDYADAKSDVVEEILARALARPPRADGVFVVFSGAPGSTRRLAVARDLARRLGRPLLSGDTVARAVTAALDRPAGSPDAAVTALLAIAADSGGAVLDAHWQPDHVDRLMALPGRHVEVVCRTDEGAAAPLSRRWPTVSVDAATADLDTLTRRVRQLGAMPWA